MRLLVAGIGDGGIAALQHIQAAGLRTVHTLAINTHSEAFTAPGTDALLLDAHTAGLGAGGDVLRGRDAAEASKDALFSALAGADHLFIAAGLGAGTGTGATPVVGYVARELQIPTTAVLTMPFTFERVQRRKVAERGLATIRALVDEAIVIEADSIFAHLGTTAALEEAFGLLQRAVAWTIFSKVINTNAT